MVANIFLRAVGKLINPLQNDSAEILSTFINEIKLNEEEEICYDALFRIWK